MLITTRTTDKSTHIRIFKKKKIPQTHNLQLKSYGKKIKNTKKKKKNLIMYKKVQQNVAFEPVP